MLINTNFFSIVNVIYLLLIFIYVALFMSKYYSAQRQPLTIKTQFFTVGASALIEVFICAWPADYLLRMVRHSSHIIKKQKNNIIELIKKGANQNYIQVS